MVVSTKPQKNKQIQKKKEKALSFNGNVTPLPASGDGALSTPTGIKAGTKGDSLVRKDNAFPDISITEAGDYVKKLTYPGNTLNQAMTNPSINLDDPVEFINIPRRFEGQNWRDVRNKYPQEIIDEIVTSKDGKVHTPYKNESSGLNVVVTKNSINHALSADTSTTKAAEEAAKQKGEKYNNPRKDIDHYELIAAIPEIIKKGIFVEEHPDTEQKGKTIYRIYAPVNISGTLAVAKLTLKKEYTGFELDDGEFAYIRQYDSSLAKKIEGLNLRSLPSGKPGTDVVGDLAPSAITIRQMLENVNDNEGNPFINPDGTGNFRIIDKNGVHEFSGNTGTDYLEQGGSRGRTYYFEVIRYGENGVSYYRYGYESGSYVSPDGTGFEQRALPRTTNLDNFHRYQVLETIIGAEKGIIASWFGEPGGGVQFKLPSKIINLLGKYLKEV